MLLIALNIVLLMKYVSIKTQNLEKNYYPVFERTLELQLEEGKIINKNIQLIESNNAKKLLKDIISNEPKVILFYNDRSCYPCVNDIVKTLESMIDSFKYIENNLVIISDEYNALYSHNLQTKFNNYKITCKLGFRNDDINEPFLFILDTNYVSSMYFIPNYHTINSLKRYLKFIEKSFFRKYPFH
jgi:hypothetical protein